MSLMWSNLSRYNNDTGDNMSFSRIKGQASAIKIIKQDLAKKRFAHAYLFVGPDGVGKASTVIEMAKAIFCSNGDTDACENCLSCKKFDHGNHPDFKKIEPENDILGIDRVRDLKREIGYKPLESRWKVYFIADAHCLTPQAANSLLKTLEEPPPFVILLITSPSESLLLPTIVSRCRVIKFNPLPGKVIENYLVQNLEAERQQAQLLASLAGGSLGRAISFYQEGSLLQIRREIIEALAGIEKWSYLDLEEVTDRLQEHGGLVGWDFVFNLILSWYRDLMVVKLGHGKKIFNQDFLPALRNAATRYNQEQLSGIIDRIQKTYNLISRNVNKQLALEVMFLKIR